MRLRSMYFYPIKQSHQQQCKFLIYLFQLGVWWNTETFIESKSWLFKIPSGMAVNINFWSRKAKFSGFPNGENHILTIFSYYFIYKAQYSLTFHRFCQKWQWISSKWKVSGYSNRNPKFLLSYSPSKMAVNINNWSREAKFSGFSNGQLWGIFGAKNIFCAKTDTPQKSKYKTSSEPATVSAQLWITW